VTVDAETFEQIAEHVHRRWAAEKQRQGFADHIFEEQTASDAIHCGRCGRLWSNHHPDMLPYAELAENVKEYDRATVRAVLAGIEAAGYLVSKRLSHHLNDPT
jgi:hypothetical protein